MSNLAQWSALVGFLLPIVVAVVQQAHWSRTVRTVIGIIAAIVAAIVTAATENKLTWHTWATSLIFVSTLAFTTYRNLWVPLGALDWWEAVTSRKSVAEVRASRVARTGEARPEAQRGY